MITAIERKLAARREELLRRSEELRSRITADAAAISSRLHVVDRTAGFLRSGGGRALVWGGIVLLLATAGPGRAVRLAGRTAMLWSFARRWVPRLVALKRGGRRA
jgi:YqjK-like protein